MSVSLTCNKRVFQVGRTVFHSNTTNTSYKRPGPGPQALSPGEEGGEGQGSGRRSERK